MALLNRYLRLFADGDLLRLYRTYTFVANGGNGGAGGALKKNGGNVGFHINLL